MAYMERGCHMSEEGLDRFRDFVCNAFRDEVKKIKNQKETVKPKEKNPEHLEKA
jgi:hypothetical protein